MNTIDYTPVTSAESLLGDEKMLPSNGSRPMVMSCDEYVNYVDELLAQQVPEAGEWNAANRSDAERHYYVIRHVVNRYAVPAVCFFGVIGNLLNLVVLTRKRLQRSMKHMERSVNEGLVSLATSDLFLCLVYFISSLYRNKRNFDSLPELYYRTYEELFINFFLLASTWLTVMMAVSRYIAVCHPLHARSFISHRGTRVTIFAVWIGSLGVNVPRFWRYQPRTLPCRLLGLDVVVPAGCQCFYYWKYPHPGGLLLNSGFATAYRAVWATVAIFVPLVALIICNWCLVKALRRSSAMQQRFCRVSSTASARVTLAESTATGSLRNRNDSVFAGPGSLRTPTTAGHRITPTLVALVVLFIVLVGPSEILTFAKDVMTRQSISGDREAYFRFASAVEITNCLLLINFASNIILYCTINAHFRRVVRHIFCGDGSLLFRWKTRSRRFDRAESATYAAIALTRPTQLNTVNAADL